MNKYELLGRGVILQKFLIFQEILFPEKHYIYIKCLQIKSYSMALINNNLRIGVLSKLLHLVSDNIDQSINYII